MNEAMTLEIDLTLLYAIILVITILILIRLFQILSGIRKIVKKNELSIKNIMESVDNISKSATGIVANVDKNEQNITNIMEGTGKITKDVSEITDTTKSFVKSTTSTVEGGVGNLNSALKSASQIMDKFGGKVE